MPMTHAPETGSVDCLHFLPLVFGAGFSYRVPDLHDTTRNVTENDARNGVNLWRRFL